MGTGGPTPTPPGGASSRHLRTYASALFGRRRATQTLVLGEPSVVDRTWNPAMGDPLCAEVPPRLTKLSIDFASSTGIGCQRHRVGGLARRRGRGPVSDVVTE